MKEKKLTIGILAHVDAGKTTLSEALLYNTGVIRKLGRVDHMDAFLDTDRQERERGITIFSKQAGFDLPDDNVRVMLLDTPGHVDFGAEAERTLNVLDFAVLVISAKDGVQGHTATIWNLLKRYRVPVVVFVNKMDMIDKNDCEERRCELISEMRENLGDGCFDYEKILTDKNYEEIAVCDEKLFEEFLENESLDMGSVLDSVSNRKIYPCLFGSALKNTGIDRLIDVIGKYGASCGYSDEKGCDDLSASVFKITRDEQGERLTHLKVTRGTLSVKDKILDEKVNQIRIYSGEKYRTAEKIYPGDIAAVTGPEKIFAGQIISEGSEKAVRPLLEAVMTYSIELDEGENVHEAYRKLKQLEEEDPQLNIVWNSNLGEIQVCLMGDVQKEVLQNIIRGRFGLNVKFGKGRTACRETVLKPVEGAGHFEPLRHYSEVHLLIEPLERGAGIELGTVCSEDVLDKNWQRLILTHLAEREHPGTLTGSPLTDVRISVLAGRAHDKHTEGGDFRQSTYRALRQALRKSLEKGEMVLLEPWYSFRLFVPQNMAGRALSDIRRMGGEANPPEIKGNEKNAKAVIEGRAPVSEMKEYVTEVAAYTKGYGRLYCTQAGFYSCHNQQEAVESSGYDADRDVENTADSIFCSHGAGHNVPWNMADEMMHVKTGWMPGMTADDMLKGKTVSVDHETGPARYSYSTGNGTENEELERIFERSKSSNRNRDKKNPGIEKIQFDSELERRKKASERKRNEEAVEKLRKERKKEEYLLIDGYNLLFAWDKLKELAKVNIDSAREALIEILNNYQGYRSGNIIVVFDAYKVKGGERRFEKNGNITVVYTGEAETADAYIEKTTYNDKEIKKNGYRIKVVTSDRMEQLIIMGNNAQRISSSELILEIEGTENEISELIKMYNLKNNAESRNRINIPEGKEKEEEK